MTLSELKQIAANCVVDLVAMHRFGRAFSFCGVFGFIQTKRSSASLEDPFVQFGFVYSPFLILIESRRAGSTMLWLVSSASSFVCMLFLLCSHVEEHRIFWMTLLNWASLNWGHCLVIREQSWTERCELSVRPVDGVRGWSGLDRNSTT